VFRDRLRSFVRRAARRVTRSSPRVPHARGAHRSPPTHRTDWTPPEAEAEPDLELPAAEVLARMAQGEDVVLVDVRASHELWSGHARGAVLLPMSAIEHGFGVLPRGPLLAIYCAAGVRSFGVADYLRRQGYDNAWSIPEGFGGWIEAGGAWLQPEAQAPWKLHQTVEHAGERATVQRVESSEDGLLVDILKDTGERLRDLSPDALTVPVPRR